MHTRSLWRVWNLRRTLHHVQLLVLMLTSRCSVFLLTAKSRHIKWSLAVSIAFFVTMCISVISQNTVLPANQRRIYIIIHSVFRLSVEVHLAVLQDYVVFLGVFTMLLCRWLTFIRWIFILLSCEVVTMLNIVTMCAGLYSPLWALVGFIIIIFLIYWLISAFELWRWHAQCSSTSWLICSSHKWPWQNFICTTLCWSNSVIWPLS